MGFSWVGLTAFVINKSIVTGLWDAAKFISKAMELNLDLGFQRVIFEGHFAQLLSPYGECLTELEFVVWDILSQSFV
jgi:hypothetical protein